MTVSFTEAIGADPAFTINLNNTAPVQYCNGPVPIADKLTIDGIPNIQGMKISFSDNYKYGEELGKIKWEERLNKKCNTIKKNKLAGKKYKNGRTLFEYQIKYGINRGYIKWNKRNNL